MNGTLRLRRIRVATIEKKTLTNVKHKKIYKFFSKEINLKVNSIYVKNTEKLISKNIFINTKYYM